MSHKSFIFLRSSTFKKGIRLRFYLSNHASEKRSGVTSRRVRIYRREQKDFIFGKDYDEFFHGLAPRKEDLIFDGPIAMKQRRKFEYFDREVQIGSIYCYWISPENRSKYIGPTAVKFRDRKVWWTEDILRRRLGNIEKKNISKVKIFECGRTSERRSLPGLIAGNQRRCIAFIGAIHAGESGPELIVPVVERLLKTNYALLKRIGILAVPTVNIDQREKMALGHPPYLRTNTNGVDLNRNFPSEWEKISYAYGLNSSDRDSPTYRGPFPGSESETQSIIGLLQKFRPIAVFSFHCLAGICDPIFLAAKAARNDAEYLNKSLDFTKSYQCGFYGAEDETPRNIHFECTEGSLPNWLYRNYKIPAFDLEWDGCEATKGCITDQTTPKMIANHVDRHYRGICAMLKQIRY